eukprot:TRINITY_DN1266_c1_g1_i5.p1 TRINITY_DN1266_c1_g1~~TRINITY_DN1266_c1_g1_i5.p1  ORF type:complete len:319 (-),score=92.03 TRINITY_DN1266_c1_g1_i5:277-1233(-)
MHETTWQEGVSKAIFAREWVAQGLRPECVAEALEKRSRWDEQMTTAAAEHGRDAALRMVAEKAQRMQVSMCAEARMREAVEEALDGSRLPAPPPPAPMPRPLRNRPSSQQKSNQQRAQNQVDQQHDQQLHQQLHQQPQERELQQQRLQQRKTQMHAQQRHQHQQQQEQLQQQHQQPQQQGQQPQEKKQQEMRQHLRLLRQRHVSRSPSSDSASANAGTSSQKTFRSSNSAECSEVGPGSRKSVTTGGGYAKVGIPPRMETPAKASDRGGYSIAGGQAGTPSRGSYASRAATPPKGVTVDVRVDPASFRPVMAAVSHPN